MNYHTNIIHFRGAYFENLTFWRALFRRGRLSESGRSLGHLRYIKERDSPLTLPVKIRFDETSQFSEVSANVSVTTFLRGLQTFPKIGKPRDITF